MIEQLCDHITDNQIDTIIEMIIKQYQRYLKFVNSVDYHEVFRDEYAPHNRQHGVSWAIASAFPSGDMVADDLMVSCLRYGKGHTRPELKNEKIVLHVFNHTTHFHAKYLDQYYKMNKAFANEAVYCYIKIQVDKKRLIKVELCVPDEDGVIVNSEVLMDRKKIELRCA